MTGFNNSINSGNLPPWPVNPSQGGLPPSNGRDPRVPTGPYAATQLAAAQALAAMKTNTAQSSAPLRGVDQRRPAVTGRDPNARLAGIISGTTGGRAQLKPVQMRPSGAPGSSKSSQPNTSGPKPGSTQSPRTPVSASSSQATSNSRSIQGSSQRNQYESVHSRLGDGSPSGPPTGTDSNQTNQRPNTHSQYQDVPRSPSTLQSQGSPSQPNTPQSLREEISALQKEKERLTQSIKDQKVYSSLGAAGRFNEVETRLGVLYKQLDQFQYGAPASAAPASIVYGTVPSNAEMPFDQQMLRISALDKQINDLTPSSTSTSTSAHLADISAIGEIMELIKQKNDLIIGLDEKKKNNKLNPEEIIQLNNLKINDMQVQCNKLAPAVSPTEVFADVGQINKLMELQKEIALLKIENKELETKVARGSGVVTVTPPPISQTVHVVARTQLFGRGNS